MCTYLKPDAALSTFTSQRPFLLYHLYLNVGMCTHTLRSNLGIHTFYTRVYGYVHIVRVWEWQPRLLIENVKLTSHHVAFSVLIVKIVAIVATINTINKRIAKVTSLFGEKTGQCNTFFPTFSMCKNTKESEGVTRRRRIAHLLIMSLIKPTAYHSIK